MINLRNLRELSRNLKVLYVEDDTAIHAKMVNYLNKFFKKVISASDGIEGLELYKKETFDIVITDLSMPRMNGLKMLQKIKEINEQQAVLITSAHTESDYMIGAIKIGVDGYIIKPFDYEQLNHELYRIVDRLRIFAQNEEYKKHLKDMVDTQTSEIRHILEFQKYNYEKTLLSMVEMVEERDTYTAGHSRRVAKYSKLIAQEMGYGSEKCLTVYQAGILHDIGKVATPDAVLLNPKQLDEIEYKLIQEHVTVSFRLLNNIPMFKELSEIVYCHHERYDGDGYPRGIKGDEIVPLARIMIVADAFDAMTTNRIYKARKTVDEALAELVELKDKQFHQEVVDKTVIVLKNIKIDTMINQLPHTKLEEERFAYFYKDILGVVYNQNYLDVVLMKNSYDNKFKHMDIFFLKHFTLYNNIYSWSEGDKLLKSFAICLSSFFEDSLVFRIFGDDFVVLSKEKIDISELKSLLDEIVRGCDVEYVRKSIDLLTVTIENISQVEGV